MRQAVIARAPLRIPLGGGGSDLPSHYRRHGGFALSATIDRHVHVLLSTAFARRFLLKHLEWEEVERPQEIRHPILRAAVEHHWDDTPFELASVGDVPPGTGLGSSSAYTVAVLAALATARDEALAPERLAARACELEIEHLGRSAGVRDQYAIAVGGVSAVDLRPDSSAAGAVTVRRLQLAEEASVALGERLLLFFAGERPPGSQMLAPLVAGSADAAVTRNLTRTAELARELAAALDAGDLDALGASMEEQWALKRQRTPAAVTDRVARLHAAATGPGRATGAVLAGAGGGGFVLAYSSDPDATRAALAPLEAPELRFAVEPRGCAAGPA